MRDGFRLSARYSSLINDLTEVRFEEGEHEARLSERIPIDPSGPGRQSNELVIAVAVRLIREGCGAEWNPTRVWFAHAAHGERAALAAYFGTHDIAFDAGWNGFAIPRAHLDLPLASSNAALLSVLEAQARGVLARYPSKG